MKCCGKKMKKVKHYITLPSGKKVKVIMYQCQVCGFLANN